jgi:uncharacterized protein (TIGR02001 family)
VKKIITTAIATGLIAAAASAEVSVTADFASAYVFRGVTFNDEAVFQPGIEAGLAVPEEYGSLSIGAWGNYDIGDYGGSIESSEFSEVDWYMSYGLPTLIEGLDLFVGYTDYTYPSAGGDADKEVNAGLGFEVAGIGLGATAYLGVGGAANGTAYYELTAGYDLTLSEELTASLGASAAYVDFEDGESGLHDGSLSAGLSYALSDAWNAGISGTYIAQLDDEVLDDVEDGGGYDVDVVGMFSIACEM